MLQVKWCIERRIGGYGKEAADNGDSTNGMAQSRGMVSKQSGLATEHIFDFWEGEVEYKVKAIWDIRENSHRHKKNLVRQ